jgi:hypothetical protein
MISLEQYLKEISKEIEIDAKEMLDEKIKKIGFNGCKLQGKVLHGGNPAEETLKYSQIEKN